MGRIVKLHDLINTCVTLTQRAGLVIRNVQSTGSLNTVQKGICSSDVFTDADLRIQKTIYHNLKELYPKARIICEEENQDLPDSIKPCIQPDQVLKQIQKGIFTSQMLHQTALQRRPQLLKYQQQLNEINQDFRSASAEDTQEFTDNLNEEDLTVWVDPLDGSKGFTEGHVHHLTCMIGISIRNRPRLGVIHKPFSTYPYPGCGRTYIGTPENGLFTVDNFVDKEGNFTPSQAQYIPPFEQDGFCQATFRPQICGSHNKNQHHMNRMLEAVRPTRVELVAGSGNKFIHLAEGLSDYYLNFVPGFKNWDMCASEALIQARFGIVTDAKKRPLLYDPDGSYTMRDGIISAKNKTIYDLCQDRIEKNMGISFEAAHGITLAYADEERRNRKQLQREEQEKQAISPFGISQPPEFDLVPSL